MKILALLPLVLFAQQPATPPADWTQQTLVLFTGLLVLVGIVTAGFIGWQSWETRKAATAAHFSADATEKSVRLQETALRQWVDVDDLKVRSQPTYFIEMSETNLVFTFNVTNPTRMPLTFEWLIVRVNSQRFAMTFHHFLAPDGFYPVTVPVAIRDKQVALFGAYKLALSFIATVGYTDAFERPQRQPFGVMCLCGPPAMCNVSPYEGPLPDDKLEKQPEP
jgi:hypothetical protein